MPGVISAPVILPTNALVTAHVNSAGSGLPETAEATDFHWPPGRFMPLTSTSAPMPVWATGSRASFGKTVTATGPVSQTFRPAASFLTPESFGPPAASGSALAPPSPPSARPPAS